VSPEFPEFTETDGAGGGPIATKETTVDISEPRQPLELRLDRYYYTPDCQAVSATIGLDDARPGQHLLVAIRRGYCATPIAEQRIPIADGRTEYDSNFGIGSVPCGRYLLTADLLDGNGKVLHSACQALYKTEFAPMKPPCERVDEVSVRGDGVLLVNGNPFCPFFASATEIHSPLARDCFNVAYSDFGLIARPLKRNSIPFGSWVRENDTVFTVLPEDTVLHNQVRDWVRKGMGDPQLFEWFISYEAQIPIYQEAGGTRVRQDNPAKLREITELVRGMDPRPLTAIQMDDLSDLPAYKDTADLIEVASWKSSYAPQLVPNLANDVEKTRAILGEGKPFFFWLGASIPNEKARTADDIRCASYLALMHGARGLVYHMGHDGIAPTSTRHWSVYSGLSREVEKLFPILISPRSGHADHVSSNSDAIDLCVRQYDAYVYIIACNVTGLVVEVDFEVKGPCSHGKVALAFENRELTLGNNGFTDHFAPYEPHVYRYPTPAAPG
jgi:hypothetical protein